MNTFFFKRKNSVSIQLPVSFLVSKKIKLDSWNIFVNIQLNWTERKGILFLSKYSIHHDNGIVVFEFKLRFKRTFAKNNCNSLFKTEFM